MRTSMGLKYEPFFGHLGPHHLLQQQGGHPAPYNPTPYNPLLQQQGRHPAPYNPAPYNLAPYTLHPTPNIIHRGLYILRYTLHTYTFNSGSGRLGRHTRTCTARALLTTG